MIKRPLQLGANDHAMDEFNTSYQRWFRGWGWLEKAASDGAKHIPDSHDAGKSWTGQGLSMNVIYALLESGWRIYPPIPNADKKETAITEDAPLWLKDLIELRRKARETKRYDEADRIRDIIYSKGYTLMDLENGETTWVK